MGGAAVVYRKIADDGQGTVYVTAKDSSTVDYCR